jgi:H+/Cl- antiporter ClcA
MVICVIGIITGLLAACIGRIINGSYAYRYFRRVARGYTRRLLLCRILPKQKGLGNSINAVKHCCWDKTGEDECPDWIHWGSTTSSLFFNNFQAYLVYVFFSITFAFTSALLVRNYAPFAAGSGIPEVKTILGGFIIKHFLGAWTLLVIRTFLYYIDQDCRVDFICCIWPGVGKRRTIGPCRSMRWKSCPETILSWIIAS